MIEEIMAYKIDGHVYESEDDAKACMLNGIIRDIENKLQKIKNSNSFKICEKSDYSGKAEELKSELYRLNIFINEKIREIDDKFLSEI